MTRYAFNLGFLDRPITIGLFFGLLSGNWTVNLGVSVFYELMWLDYFPAGTYVPPHRLISTFLALVIVQVLSLTTPWQILPVLVVSLPFSWIGSFLEHKERLWQNNKYKTMLGRKENVQTEFVTSRDIQISLLQKIFINCGFFIISFLIVYFFLQYLFLFWPNNLNILNWYHLWSISLVGAILSLRIPIAFEILAGGAFLIFIVLWF